MFSSMLKRGLAATLLLLASGVTLTLAHDPKPSEVNEGKLIVHEWGTFLSVQGSDGVTLGGMVDSEELLPDFVRERALAGRNRAGFMSKMETPVTYFYVDRPRDVEVRVEMPSGLLTHWYPIVSSFGQLGCRTTEPGSYLDWGKIHLIPTQRETMGPPAPLPTLRAVDENSTWRFARETDAAIVKIDPRRTPVATRPAGEFEKFLFYRGLGRFTMPMEVRSEDLRVGSQLKLHNSDKEALRGVFVINVTKDTIQFAARPELAGVGSDAFRLDAEAKPIALKEGVPQVKKAVAASLVRAGLYEKEANAMVNTWERSYFRMEGLRILYILPRSTVDATIPIRIKPAPQELERVMVGRVEVLTPGQERRLEKAVADLGDSHAEVRRAAELQLNELGRLREPVLHRIAAMTTRAEVRTRAEELIKKAAQ